MDKRYYEPEVSVHFLSVEGGFAASTIETNKDTNSYSLERVSFDEW